tara:strand:- start:1 stop:168 length:168 start_codon:yes stop_codon:yes gene_type:complete
MGGTCKKCGRFLFWQQSNSCSDEGKKCISRTKKGKKRGIMREDLTSWHRMGSFFG